MASMREMGPEELRSRLLAFDRAVALLFPGETFRLVLVGGGALVLLGYLDRSTTDLDVRSAPAQLQALMAEYDLSGQVAAYDSHFPYNMDDRLVALNLPTESVKCFAASLEDLVTSKLASERASDAADVRKPAVLAALDWGKLAETADEMKDSSLNERRYREFRQAYEAYVKECGPCAA